MVGLLDAVGDCAAPLLLSREPITHGPIVEVTSTTVTIWARGSGSGAFKATASVTGPDNYLLARRTSTSSHGDHARPRMPTPPPLASRTARPPL